MHIICEVLFKLKDVFIKSCRNWDIFDVSTPNESPL